MESVNILRLKTGEDIICYMEHYGHDEVVVREPMMVMVRTDYKTGKRNVGMDHWLPISLLRDNEAIIKTMDILAVLTPSSEFSEYYQNAVAVVKQFKDVKEDELAASDDAALSQDDMSLILDTLDTTDTKVAH